MEIVRELQTGDARTFLSVPPYLLWTPGPSERSEAPPEASLTCLVDFFFLLFVQCLLPDQTSRKNPIYNTSHVTSHDLLATGHMLVSSPLNRDHRHRILSCGFSGSASDASAARTRLRSKTQTQNTRSTGASTTLQRDTQSETPEETETDSGGWERGRSEWVEIVTSEWVESEWIGWEGLVAGYPNNTCACMCLRWMQLNSWTCLPTTSGSLWTPGLPELFELVARLG